MKEFLSIGTKDVIKGAIMAAIAVVLTALITSIDAGHFPSSFEDIKPMLVSAVGAFVTYLLKNLFTNSDGKFLKREAGDDGAVNKTLIIVGFVLLSAAAYSQVQDSTIIHNAIVKGTDEVLQIVPDSPLKTVATFIHIALGSLLTGLGIHYFRKKNKK
jgi:hypothetical protein